MDLAFGNEDEERYVKNATIISLTIYWPGYYLKRITNKSSFLCFYTVS